MRIEVLVDVKTILGEGPLWDVEQQRLYWIDSYGAAVHRADLKGGDRKTWKVPEPIGSLALREKGGAVLSLRSGFHFLDFESGAVTRINETQPGELQPRLNGGNLADGAAEELRASWRRSREPARGTHQHAARNRLCGCKLRGR